jgi:hypothetical protein
MKMREVGKALEVCNANRDEGKGKCSVGHKQMKKFRSREAVQRQR